MVTHQCFKGLADPIRCAILDLLSRESLNVSGLAAHFDVSRPAISRHLRVLREAGLVTEVKSGREHTYSLAPPTLEAAAEWLHLIAEGGGSPRGLAALAPAPPSAEDPGGWRQW